MSKKRITEEGGIFVPLDGDKGTTMEYMEDIGKLPSLKGKHVVIDSIRDIRSDSASKVPDKTLLFKMKDGKTIPTTEAKEEAGKYWVEHMKVLKKLGLSGFAFEYRMSDEQAERDMSLTQGIEELNRKLGSGDAWEDEEVESLLDTAEKTASHLIADEDDEDDEDEDEEGDDEDEEEDEEEEDSIESLGLFNGKTKKSAFVKANIAKGAHIFRRLFKQAQGAKTAKRYALLKRSLLMHIKLLSQEKTLSQRDLKMVLAGLALSLSVGSNKHRALTMGSVMSIHLDLEDSDDD